MLRIFLFKINAVLFEISIHQRIVKKKNVSLFSQKYEAAQQFLTLIIRNDS